MPPSDWQTWSTYVLEEIKRLNTSVDKLHIELDNYRKDLEERVDSQVDELQKQIIKIQLEQMKLRTEFNLKSGVWGLLAGCVPTIAYIMLRG